MTTALDTTRLLTAERFFINTGMRSLIPSLPGLIEAGFLSSESIAIGESAYRTGNYSDSNTDNNENKVNNALLTLFGALAHLLRFN